MLFCMQLTHTRAEQCLLLSLKLRSCRLPSYNEHLNNWKFMKEVYWYLFYDHLLKKGWILPMYLAALSILEMGPENWFVTIYLSLFMEVHWVYIFTEKYLYVYYLKQLINWTATRFSKEIILIYTNILKKQTCW